MGLFKKRERVHFKRNGGQVTGVERTGDVSRTPVSDALLKQQEKKKKRSWFNPPPQKHRGKSRGRSYSTNNNYNPFGSMFDMGMDYGPVKKTSGKQKYFVKGGRAYPIVQPKKKKTKKRSKDPFDFDITDNWGFFK